MSTVTLSIPDWFLLALIVLLSVYCFLFAIRLGVALVAMYYRRKLNELSTHLHRATPDQARQILNELTRKLKAATLDQSVTPPKDSKLN